MIKKILILFCFVCLNYISYGQTMKQYKTTDILELLEKIEAYPEWYLLLTDSHFQQLQSIANNIVTESVFIFKTDTVSYDMKVTLLLALQAMTFEKYTYFLSRFLSLYLENYINDDLFCIALDPFGFSVMVKKNYKNKDIQQILKRCLEKEGQTERLQRVIKEIQSGSAWRKYRWQRIVRNLGFSPET